MKIAYLACLVTLLANPALAQDVTFSCTYPFGDQSLGVLASNAGSDAKTCDVACSAFNSDGYFFITTCYDAVVPAGANNLLLCSRGDASFSIGNAQVANSQCR